MRTANFARGRLAAGFFRICLGIIVSLTLAAGGMALNTQPVQAVTINPAGPTAMVLTECKPYTMTFTLTPTPCAAGYVPVYQFFVIGTLPPNSFLDMNTGVFTCCPDLGTNGQFGVFNVVGSEFAPPRFIGDFPCGANWSLNSTVNWSILPIGVINPLIITPVYYAVAWEGMPFNMTLAATGCSGSYNWTATGLPAGLSVTDATNGVISGIPGPGTCGSWPVTVTCTDTVMCPSASCCPPASKPFTLIVDCWANYIVLFPASTSCDFNVAIGPGLGAGQTPVLINGTQQFTLGANQSQNFTSDPCQSNLVMVNQTVAGPDPNTSFECIGPNYKMVNDTDNYAYFDYAQKVVINTGSDPGGIASIPGAGSYAIGSYFNTTAPSPVDSSIQKERFLFSEWMLPDGSTNPNRDLAFTVNKAGTVTAKYDTYYQLNIVSVDVPYSDSSWELKDSTATYNVALQSEPTPNFLGLIGGVRSPVQPSGTIVMDGTKTVNIQWTYDYTVPVILIVVTLLVIAGLIFWLSRRKGTGTSAVPATTVAQAPPPSAATTEVKTTPVVTETVKKKALKEAKSTEKPNFCPNCGAPVEKDAVFCKKCGKNLQG